jgi:hypothetical protein
MISNSNNSFVQRVGCKKCGRSFSRRSNQDLLPAKPSGYSIEIQYLFASFVLQSNFREPVLWSGKRNNFVKMKWDLRNTGK